MQQETLRALKRTISGSRPARRMRRDGQIPAVVYGVGIDTQEIAIERRSLLGVLNTEAGLNALINVQVEDGDEVLTVAREVQRDPVRGDITHLDFIKVSLDIAIDAEVGLEFIGTPQGVKDEGGFIETIENAVMISALPTAIPTSIAVDISELGIGDTLKVEDLPVMEGVTYLTEPDRPLVTVLLPSVVEEEVPEDLLEGEEGEALEEGEVGDEASGDESDEG
ncbi:MAG: 50S ribosomal protein L25 [Acidimicrobiia bacterium]